MPLEVQPRLAAEFSDRRTLMNIDVAGRVRLWRERDRESINEQTHAELSTLDGGRFPVR